MVKPDYDDPDVEERWCEAQRGVVADYLRSQKVDHGRIGDWPAWHVAAYVRQQSLERLNAFINDQAGTEFERRLAFVRWVMPRAGDPSDGHLL